MPVIVEKPIKQVVKKKPVETPPPKGMMPSAFRVGKKVPIVPVTKSVIPGKMRLPITREYTKMSASPKASGSVSTIPKRAGNVPIARPTSGSPDVGKLNALIADPRVQGVECTGPNNMVLVRKDGSIQKTKVTLTESEIKTIINHFSEQTRIPLIGGTFKAALGNLVITAVLSDFVGARFILQKKNPFNPLLPNVSSGS